MKKALCILLSLIMLLSASTTAFASEMIDKSFCIDDYNQYTIKLFDETLHTRSTTENTIDTAISYVKSLNLKDMGYSYIEEACLEELDSYKDDDVVLESYTVLVPKARAKSYYGTYLNSDYYYEYTSVSDMRRETNGAEKGASNESKWNNWILGAMDLGMCFATKKMEYSIYYH